MDHLRAGIEILPVSGKGNPCKFRVGIIAL